MRILFLGTNRELGLFRVEVLENQGFHVLFPHTKREAINTINEGSFDLALVSYSLPNETAQELVELVRQQCPLCPVISISENGWDEDPKLQPDATILAQSGPKGMVEAIQKARSNRLRRIK